MKWMGLVAAAILMLQKSDYPPPYPRPGATLVLENERVKIWDVTWQKGVATPMHEHRVDLVGVTLAGGRVKATFPDGTSRTNDGDARGDVSFGGRGLLHQEEGVSDNERRAILVELKDVAVDAPKPPPGTHPAPAWPRDGSEKILENDRVVVWEYEFREDREIPTHFHDKDTVVVELGAGVTRSVPVEGQPSESTWVGDRARFSPKGRLHREEWVSGSPHSIVIELK